MASIMKRRHQCEIQGFAVPRTKNNATASRIIGDHPSPILSTRLKGFTRAEEWKRRSSKA